MEREALRDAMEILAGRVRLVADPPDCKLVYDDLDRDGMVAAGIAEAVADRLADAPWWAEMIVDVEETPEFCEPEATAEEVLEYGRDVVREYFRKRF